MIRVIVLSFLLSGCIKKTVATNETEGIQSTNPSHQLEKHERTVPVATGFLDKSLIDTEIKNHMKQISSCYTKMLKEIPSLQGRLMVKFDIKKDGSVSNATTTEDTLGSDKFATCVLDEFMKMQFPTGMKSDMVNDSTQSKGGMVSISYPLLFSLE